MNKFYIYLILILPLLGFSQPDYGIKAAVSFNASGKITNIVGDFQNPQASLDNATGYSIGAYGKINLILVYLRPELQFTRYAQNFESITLKQSKIELPVSVGFNFLPFLSVFGGPSFHYVISQSSKEVTVEQINEKTSLGLHIGTRVELGPIGLDLRYERGLKQNEIGFIENNGLTFSGNLDSRPSQWVFGISYSFN